MALDAPAHTLSIGELAPLLRSGAVSSAAVVRACLETIAQRNPELNAFIDVWADAALADARHADAELEAGRDRGALHGIPVSIKDLIDVRGTPTTAGSRVRAGHVARDDAPIVARLRTAGAVLVGKTNLHEFACGTTSDESAFGPVRNPWDARRSPGGSSGGSAAAVAAGMCVASLGTDTGGSVRVPAAACGIVGLKPAFGDIPCDGVVPLSPSLDHVGPLARTVADARILYEALGGRRTATARGTRRQFRLGALRGYFTERLDPDVRQQFEAAVKRVGDAGHAVDTVELRHAEHVPTVYLLVVLSEAAAYHARTLETRPDDYTRPVRLRLELGRCFLAEDYVRAQRAREALRHEVDAALGGRDALLLPALAIPAPPVGAPVVTVDGAEEGVRAITLRLTQLFNLTGHPALSMPCGFTRDGLPCGLQIVGRRADTSGLLHAAQACEAQVTVGSGSVGGGDGLTSGGG